MVHLPRARSPDVIHWTVFVMSGVCLICGVLNSLQWKMTGAVRPFGLAVCAAWALQEAVWWEMGEDSVILIFACDFAILWAAWKRRPLLEVSDRLIIAILPATMACVLFIKLNGHPTANSFWVNWSMVLAQMLLGLPRPKWQRGLSFFSHGPLRRLENNSGGI